MKQNKGSQRGLEEERYWFLRINVRDNRRTTRPRLLAKGVRRRWHTHAWVPALLNRSCKTNPRLPFPRILSAKSITPVWNRLPPRFSSADSQERRMSSPLVVVRSSLFLALSWTDMSADNLGRESVYLWAAERVLDTRSDIVWWRICGSFNSLKNFSILGLSELFDGEFLDKEIRGFNSLMPAASMNLSGAEAAKSVCLQRILVPYFVWRRNWRSDNLGSGYLQDWEHQIGTELVC